MKMEQVEVGELLADVATSFSGQAETAGVDLQSSILGEGLLIQGDAGRLDQVLSNLVANALDHTPRGGQIRISAAPGQDGVQIKVADNGRGIAEEDVPFIFDRFWRGEGARQASSGLGLAIAQQLVQAHGGQIGVESRLN